MSNRTPRTRRLAAFVALLSILLVATACTPSFVETSTAPAAAGEGEPPTAAVTDDPLPTADPASPVPPANTADPGQASNSSPTEPPAAAPTEPPTPLPGPTQTPIPFGDVASGIPYRLPLVVQHVTETTAVLFFELHSAAQGVLLYWPEANPTAQQVVSLRADRQSHQIVLEGLQPGTGYAAVVGLGPEASNGEYREPSYRGELWGSVRFATATAERVDPLRIGVIGDSGFGDDVTYRLAEQMGAADLDFVLHTGDVVYQMYNDADAFESYANKWYLPFAPVLKRMPVYAVIGNHDVEEAAMFEGMPFYYRVFPAFPDPRFENSTYSGRNMWYAFAYGDIQFLMLDTQVFFNEGGRPEQEQWMAERLADDRFRATIPVSHVPPMSFGRYEEGTSPVSSWLLPWQEARVPLTAHGHDHNYERFTQGEITHVVSGGGSVVLYPQGQPMPEGGVFLQQSHWVLLEVYEDRIDVRAYGADGTELDEASVPLPQAEPAS